MMSGKLNKVIVGDLEHYFSSKGNDPYAKLEYFINTKTKVKTLWNN